MNIGEVKMRKSLIGVSAGLVLLVVVNGAFADLVPVGDPFAAASWAQTFAFTGYDSVAEEPYSVNLLAVKMLSAGDTFQSAVFMDFTTAGWSPLSLVPESWGNTPTLGVASGPSQQVINFALHFPDPVTNSFTFGFVAFAGDALRYAVDYSWNGSTWSVGKGTWEPTRASLTPVPGAVILGMLGMGVAGLKLRKHV